MRTLIAFLALASLASAQNPVYANGNRVKLSRLNNRHALPSRGLEALWVTGVRNLIANPEPLLAQITVTAGVSQATFAENGLANGVAFVGAAQNDYAVYVCLMSLGATYTLSVFVVMDDASAPTNSDFGSFYEDAIHLWDSFDYVGGSVYRARVTWTSTVGALKQVGIYRQAGSSGKGFRVTGFQLNTGSTALPYDGNTADPSLATFRNLAKPERRNLLAAGSTENFASAAWYWYEGATPAANSVTFPNGSYGLTLHGTAPGAYVISLQASAASSVSLQLLARESGGDYSTYAERTCTFTTTVSTCSLAYTKDSDGNLARLQIVNSSGSEVVLSNPKAQAEIGAAPTPYQNPDSLYTLTLGTGSNAPTVGSTGLSFSGVDDKASFPGTLDLTQFTALAVGKANTPRTDYAGPLQHRQSGLSGFQWVADAAAVGPRLTIWNGAAETVCYVSTAGATWDSTWGSHAWTWDGSVASLFGNGGSVAITATGTGFGNDGSLIGQGYSYWNGELFATAIYSRAASAAEIARADRYLKTIAAPKGISW